MRPEISILCLICAGFLITSSSAQIDRSVKSDDPGPDPVSKPTIYDNSTKDQLILDCVSDTPAVTYKWLDSQGTTLTTQQIYIASRPKEEVTLTCTAYNRGSAESQNITIPYSPERKGLSGCAIAWIVVGVIVGVLALLYLCIFCVLAKLLGGGANACMASGIMCCLCTCFCCKGNWKKGLSGIVSAILPFIEEKMGGKNDAEKGEELSSIEEKEEGRNADDKEQAVNASG